MRRFFLACAFVGLGQSVAAQDDFCARFEENGQSVPSVVPDASYEVVAGACFAQASAAAAVTAGLGVSLFGLCMMFGPILYCDLEPWFPEGVDR